MKFILSAPLLVLLFAASTDAKIKGQRTISGRGAELGDTQRNLQDWEAYEVQAHQGASVATRKGGSSSSSKQGTAMGEHSGSHLALRLPLLWPHSTESHPHWCWGR